MRPLVYVETGFLGEPLEAEFTLVGTLASVRAVVYLQVLLAGEGGGTCRTLERPTLDYTPPHNHQLERPSPRPHTLYSLCIHWRIYARIKIALISS